MSDAKKSATDESPGTLLKRLREEQGLSAEDVAGKLYLEPWIIEALEADDLERLSGYTYIRGYLRGYAGLLGVPAESILDIYQNETFEPPPFNPDRHKSQQTSSRDKSVAAVSWLVALLLVVLLFTWWKSNFSLDGGVFTRLFTPDTETEQGISQLSYEIPIVEHPDSPFYRAPETTDTTTLRKAGVRLPDVPATMNDEQADDILGSIEYGDGPDTLEVRLSADSWVKVQDYNDETIYIGLGRAGQTLLLHGTAPMNVLLGFSQGATIKFNGQNFDLAPFSRANIARFTVGE
ncbi:MAG: helix-turn-helix domain-containing protein [Gammaproteobacteria bacterium]